MIVRSLIKEGKKDKILVQVGDRAIAKLTTEATISIDPESIINVSVEKEVEVLNVFDEYNVLNITISDLSSGHPLIVCTKKTLVQEDRQC